VSKCTQTQQVDAKKIKNFLGRSVRLECLRYLWIHYWLYATALYVMPHVLAIVEICVGLVLQDALLFYCTLYTDCPGLQDRCFAQVICYG